MNEENMNERVEHPKYYKQNKLGIEVIDITRDLDFCTGNVIKYILRAGYKKEEGLSVLEKKLEDYKKARFYLNDLINQTEKLLNYHK